MKIMKNDLRNEPNRKNNNNVVNLLKHFKYIKHRFSETILTITMETIISFCLAIYYCKIFDKYHKYLFIM